MNKEQVDRLNVKLVATQTYLNETEDRKKAVNGNLNEDIKGCKKRINALVDAINEKSFEPLAVIFAKEEVEFFESGRKERG